MAYLRPHIARYNTSLSRMELRARGRATVAFTAGTPPTGGGTDTGWVDSRAWVDSAVWSDA